MQIVIITGGSRGIGRAAAIACAQRGLDVIVTYNTHKPGADAVVREVQAVGRQAAVLALNVADTSSFDIFAEQLTQVLGETWGRTSFDGLVNNAGIGGFNPIESVSEAEFDGLFNVHLKGPFFLTQRLLPMMADGGAIVNVTSATTRVATAGVAPYAAFKGGLEVLTRYMAKEFGLRRIRANAVSPGATRTDLGGNPLDNHPEFAELLASQTALGRVGEPEDVGRVIATLLSGDSSWINAQSIEVGGGYCI
ncbi:SDR family NAD(P)-dependent oxidoreductase [Lysobacter sp. CA199]|uniref:SDR family NAD(P)-dependent oxidoreductase n=1 Tax=Lysobacter sp. CA199 TaxID=3455608 RepID=UPI003F8D1738